MKTAAFFILCFAIGAHASTKDDALKYLNALIVTFNSTADETAGSFDSNVAELLTNFNATRNTNYQNNLGTYINYNDRAYDYGCSSNVFWAYNGVRQEINEWFDTCVGIDAITAQFVSFISKINGTIDVNKEAVAEAISFVASCDDGDDDCVANGTLAFLSVLGAENNKLNIDIDRVKSFETELEQSFVGCETSVSGQVQTTLESYQDQYCTGTTPVPTTRSPTTSETTPSTAPSTPSVSSTPGPGTTPVTGTTPAA